jgi:predicted house-cleaning noncanonical NTP pyrophosphatase (MazG superfamily)
MRQEKLVRDKIPDIIRASGTDPFIRIADPGEYRDLLRAKLAEEVQEFLDSDRDVDVEELADILEVVFTLAERAGISRGDLEDIRAAKAEERGGFTQGVVWAITAYTK